MIPRFVSSVTLQELITALFSRKNRLNDCNDLRKFTEAFAQYIGVQYAVFVSSARTGLAALLYALDLPKGGEVILPALTHHRIASLFKDFGLKPRFVDIDRSTYCIDTDQLKKAITSSTVAVVPVHIYGRACDMDTIKKIALQHNLVIIEDCAQACGASCSGKRLGSFGSGAVFSLGYFKNISALGAGMVVTDSPELAARISIYIRQLPHLSTFGLVKRLLFAVVVCSITKPLLWNGIIAHFLKFCAVWKFDPIERFTTESSKKRAKAEKQTRLMPKPLQGIIGKSQLMKLDDANWRRIHNGNQLLELLKNVENIKLPAPSIEGNNIYMSFPVLVKDPIMFRQKMLYSGVDTHPGDKTFVSHLSGLDGSQKCSIAAQAIESMVHLPIYPQMTDSDLSKVVDAVKCAASN